LLSRWDYSAKNAREMLYQKYGKAVTSGFQPENAFAANAKAMIAGILRDLTT
jgi:hypothetical protein